MDKIRRTAEALVSKAKSEASQAQQQFMLRLLANGDRSQTSVECGPHTTPAFLEELCDVLSRNLTVTTLRIDGARMSGHMQPLATLVTQTTTLTELRIAGAGLTDEDASTLFGGLIVNASIASLLLPDNALSKAQCVLLLLEHNQALVSLDISGNRLGRGGDDEIFALADGVGRSRRLESLALAGNGVSEAAAEKFCSVLDDAAAAPKLRRLDIGSDALVRPETRRRLRDLVDARRAAAGLQPTGAAGSDAASAASTVGGRSDSSSSFSLAGGGGEATPRGSLRAEPAGAEVRVRSPRPAGSPTTAAAAGDDGGFQLAAANAAATAAAATAAAAEATAAAAVAAATRLAGENGRLSERLASGNAERAADATAAQRRAVEDAETLERARLWTDAAAATGVGVARASLAVVEALSAQLAAASARTAAVAAERDAAAAAVVPLTAALRGALRAGAESRLALAAFAAEARSQQQQQLQLQQQRRRRPNTTDAGGAAASPSQRGGEDTANGSAADHRTPQRTETDGTDVATPSPSHSNATRFVPFVRDGVEMCDGECSTDPIPQPKRRAKRVVRPSSSTPSVSQRAFTPSEGGACNDVEFGGVTAPMAKSSWIPDDQVSLCMACTKPFSVTRRKHHCRRCGCVFCDPCCPQPSGGRGSRLCVACRQVFRVGSLQGSPI